MQNSNGVLYELVHALAGAALDILLDQFLDLRPQSDIHGITIPHGAIPSRPTNSAQ